MVKQRYPVVMGIEWHWELNTYKKNGDRVRIIIKRLNLSVRLPA
jgi:hypothetical protein